MSTTETETPTTNTPRAKPIDKVRHGNIHASIWRNVDREGRVWYSTAVERSYKNRAGTWKPTSSFGRDELLVLAEVVRSAYERIRSLQTRDREASANNTDALTGEVSA